MNNVKQIQIITRSLDSEKDKQINELEKLNTLLNKKTNSYQTMTAYLKDYLNDDNLVLTKSTPGLSKNIHLFIDKINEAMRQSESEMEILTSARIKIIEKISHINKKIDLMGIFENSLHDKAKVLQEKKDQAMIDDIISTHELRKENE